MHKVKIILDSDMYSEHKNIYLSDMKQRPSSEYQMMDNGFINHDNPYMMFLPVRLISFHNTLLLNIPEVNQNGSKNNYLMVAEREVLKISQLTTKLYSKSEIIEYEFIGLDYYLDGTRKKKRISFKRKTIGIYMPFAFEYEYNLVNFLKGKKFKNYLHRKGELNSELITKLDSLEFDLNRSKVKNYLST